ncbi:hypothetical protein Cgig2_023396 [Carnegiea gigantea]|uniref:SNRNP25 ubiquitin-like domain-containing protein n=1 Tax=Carnegiea gigantea TaxID=171969 RepID=A0A9Q1GGZ7_9CARY|nr:hypothetical protein Cgig2_023396 [Carnegiea gigantea]
MRKLSFEEEVEEDYFSRVTLEPPPHHRRSFRRNPSSLTSVLSFVNSRKKIEVTKQATIAELKQAIQNYFSHLATEGPCKISWRQVWGHFCLTYDGKKLLNDDESIKIYSMKDGDELHFVQHVSADMLIKQQSKKWMDTPNTHRIIENEEKDACKEDEGVSDLEDITCQQLKHEENDNSYDHEPDHTCNLFKGWFQYSRISSMDRSETESRRWEGGFVGFIRSIFHFCGNRCPAYSSRVSRVDI